MIRLVTLIVLFQACFPSSAQTDSTKVRMPRIKMGLYAGASSIYGNFANLNEAIVAQGYPAVQDVYSGGSFGYSFRRPGKSSYTSFSFSFLSTNPSPLYDKTRTKDTRVKMVEFQFGNYFDVAPHPKWLVYPYLGFGAGLTNLILYNNVNTQTSFALSIANLNLPAAKIWTDFYIYLNAGVGFERKFRVGSYDFYTGLGGGYRLSTNAKFREAYQNYSDSPSTSLSGLEWNFRMRFEMWRHITPRSKSHQGIY